MVDGEAVTASDDVGGKGLVQDWRYVNNDKPLFDPNLARDDGGATPWVGFKMDNVGNFCRIKT